MLAPPVPLAYDARQRMGAMNMLAMVKDRAAALAVFDPQYRGILDKMKYGNEGARQAGRAALPQQGYRAIVAILDELERVLRPGGHVLLWMDKFAAAEGHHAHWVPEGLRRVDLISWNKGRPGMGRRSRCRTEFMLILQKPPTGTKGMWLDRGIDDCWTEQADRTGHPHAKPLQLTQRIIRTVTKRGDLVIDPCAGGYGVLESCRATGRRFLGCDIAGDDDGV